MSFLIAPSIAWLIAPAVTIAMSGGIVLAQAKPTATDVGGESPRSAMFIGNSFFYDNDGIQGVLGRLTSAVGGKFRSVIRDRGDRTPARRVIHSTCAMISLPPCSQPLLKPTFSQ